MDNRRGVGEILQGDGGREVTPEELRERIETLVASCPQDAVTLRAIELALLLANKLFHLPLPSFIVAWQQNEAANWDEKEPGIAVEWCDHEAGADLAVAINTATGCMKFDGCLHLRNES